MFQVKRFTYLILIILSITAILIWSAVFWQAPDNLLEVYFFDVGQGDSIFIETPAGRQVLIDGGPDKAVLAELNQVMPFYDRTIDLIILTHPDADHITGLVEVLNYYQIGHILTSGFRKETAVYQRWEDLVAEKSIPLTIAQTGQKIIFPAGPSLEVLWPEQSSTKYLAQKANNVSVVGRLVYDQMEFLLTGDIEKDVEQYLVSHWPVDRLRSDVLKVPHHGSKTSSSQKFLEAVNPQVAIISVGQENRYGHPHSDVLKRLKDFSVYRTDRDGRIQIYTDGIWFEIATTE